MQANNFRYYINFEIPAIEYTSDLVIQFLVIKEPISKYATIAIINCLMNDVMYKELADFISANSFADLYLNIYTIKDPHNCVTIDLKDPNFKDKITVKNKPFYVVKTSVIDRTPVADDKIGYYYTQLILADPKAFQLDKSYELTGAYNNITVKQIIQQYLSILNSVYSIQPYECITYNSYKYPQLSIKQDISMLELPFYLQMNYKLSNGLPITFYDSFSSFEIFQTYELYKCYDLMERQRFIKKDLTQNKTLTQLYTIKTETITHSKLVKYLTNSPYKIIFVHDDGSTKVIQNSTNSNVTSSTVKDKNGNIIYVNKNKSYNDKFVYNLHVIDNEQQTLSRLESIKKLFNDIHHISRIRLTDVNFMDFDIGVMYKFNKKSTYNSTFLNICYYFALTNGLYQVCDVIGDVIVFNE